MPFGEDVFLHCDAAKVYFHTVHKVFYRIKILDELGMEESLIRKQLLHNRRFVDAYKSL